MGVVLKRAFLEALKNKQNNKDQGYVTYSPLSCVSIYYLCTKICKKMTQFTIQSILHYKAKKPSPNKEMPENGATSYLEHELFLTKYLHRFNTTAYSQKTHKKICTKMFVQNYRGQTSQAQPLVVR